jgi:hypothetical protein
VGKAKIRRIPEFSEVLEINDLEIAHRSQQKRGWLNETKFQVEFIITGSEELSQM